MLSLSETHLAFPGLWHSSLLQVVFDWTNPAVVFFYPKEAFRLHKVQLHKIEHGVTTVPGVTYNNTYPAANLKFLFERQSGFYIYQVKSEAEKK